MNSSTRTPTNDLSAPITVLTPSSIRPSDTRQPAQQHQQLIDRHAQLPGDRQLQHVDPWTLEDSDIGHDSDTYLQIQFMSNMPLAGSHEHNAVDGFCVRHNTEFSCGVDTEVVADNSALQWIDGIADFNDDTSMLIDSLAAGTEYEFRGYQPCVSVDVDDAIDSGGGYVSDSSGRPAAELAPSTPAHVDPTDVAGGDTDSVHNETTSELSTAPIAERAVAVARSLHPLCTRNVRRAQRSILSTDQFKHRLVSGDEQLLEALCERSPCRNPTLVIAKIHEKCGVDLAIKFLRNVGAKRVDRHAGYLPVGVLHDLIARGALKPCGSPECHRCVTACQ
jgi:hypothetical protein